MSPSSAPVTSIEQITPEWLGQVLPGLPGPTSVATVATERIGSGQLGATYLLTPHYEGDRGTAPERVVAKLPALDEGSRAFAASLGCYTREVAFYAELARRLPTRTPECYHAEAAEDGLGFCLILEDLTPASESGQIDGCDADRAAAALDQAAALHAGSWRDESLRGLDWLSGGVEVWRRMCTGAPQAQAAFRERYAGMLDDVTLRVAAEFANGAASAWMEKLAEPRCLWHSDFRLDNLLFEARSGEVPVAVVDWQSVTLAAGPVDASYFVGAGLQTETRREHEDALLRRYHAALLDGGVTDYPWVDCVAEYRVNALAGFIISMVASVSTARSPEADAMFTTMAARHAAHIEDCGSFALLEG